MNDSNRYQQHLQLKEKEWEALCGRCGACCGACCGAADDPCENLRRTETGKYFCNVYERRLGTWRTVSGKTLVCVPIREKLSRGESWPGDEHCGYKKVKGP